MPQKKARPREKPLEAPLESEVRDQRQHSIGNLYFGVRVRIGLVVVPLLLARGRIVIDVDDFNIPAEITPFIRGFARIADVQAVRIGIAAGKLV